MGVFLGLWRANVSPQGAKLQEHTFQLIRLFVPLLLVLCLALIGCGSDDVTPTLVPTLPPPKPVVTNTRVVITAVPQTVPTRAPITPAPNASTNICPFTGLPLNGVNLAERRPLLVKIGNSPPERPQAGLAEADVVVEHLTEGAITRFSAVFYCNDAAEIGPIRSARLIDLELAPIFGAIFAHVGGSEPVRQMIAQSEIAKADFDDYGRAPIFREIAERNRPFNLYTSTTELWTLARDKGLINSAAVPQLMFDAQMRPGGHAGAMVTIPYRTNLSDAVFTYDGASQRYRRSIGTIPHVDAVTNQPLTAANVIVMYALHETTNIVEDSLGSRSVIITVSGSGKATILRDGQAYDVTWTRNDPHSFWSFDANGRTVPLKPGNVWIEVVPPEMQVKVQ